MQNSLSTLRQRILRHILFKLTKILSFFRCVRFNILPFTCIKYTCYIEHNVKLSTFYGGSINIGKNCELRNGSRILTYGGNITIGNNCSINPFTILYGQGNLVIGDNVRIAAHCIIIPSNHIFSDPDAPIAFQGLSKEGIIIHDDVWIGCGVRILDGVKIAKGCVIGAGSVVTKSTIPYGVYVGTPAKLIKKRK